MIEMEGMISLEGYAGDLYVFRSSQGVTYEVCNAVDRIYLNKKVVISAKKSENQFSINMVGERIEVFCIKERYP